MKLQIFYLLASGMLFMALSLRGVAQDFQQYPGSRVDERASRTASAPGVVSIVYTTSDRFENIVAFYKARYPETRWPVPAPTLPSGRNVQWAFFVIDGAKDLAHSGYWMKIQRPYAGTLGDAGQLQDVRDISLIQLVRKI